MCAAEENVRVQNAGKCVTPRWGDYVGLQNPGCLCYMNSCLQQLFRIPAFVDAVMTASKSTVDDEPNRDESSEGLLTELQTVFSQLALTERQWTSATGICLQFTDIEGNP